MSEIESTITASSRMVARPCVSEGIPPDGTYWPNGGGTSIGLGLVFYLRAGLHSSVAEYPHPGFAGDWHFAEWGAGGPGTVDYAGDQTGNVIRCVAVGPGRITVHTATYHGTVRHLRASLISYDLVLIDYVTLESQTGDSGTSFTFVVPDDRNCYHWVDVKDVGVEGGSKFGFSGFDWDTSDVARLWTGIGGHVTYSAEMAGGR